MSTRISISDDFWLDEFASHDGASYPIEWIESRLKPLCQVLEVIREACGGRPVRITSGYRSPAHNAKVGGAQHSQHMEGKAADIEIDGMLPSAVHKVILDLYGSGAIEIGGLGVYPNWCHVDIRDRINGHLAQWTGTKIGSEVT